MNEDDKFTQVFEDMEAVYAPVSPPVAKKNRRSKPKVVESWTEGNTFKLIANVKGHACVWNAGDPNYSDKTARKHAWSSITYEFENKFNEKEVNAKWSNMRIQYRSYAVQAKTKSDKGFESIPKWKYFNAMSFLSCSEATQRSGSISNISFNDSNDDASSCRITTPTRRIAQDHSSTPSSSSVIVETMRESVATIRAQKEDDRNVSLSKYILSELRAISENDANLLRTRLQRTLLEFAEERQSRNTSF